MFIILVSLCVQYASSKGALVIYSYNYKIISEIIILPVLRKLYLSFYIWLQSNVILNALRIL